MGAVPVPVPAVPALPSFLIPTRKHFFRRQYWHWLRWCWSIWQSRLDLQGGQGRRGTGQHRDAAAGLLRHRARAGALGHGPAASSRCHAAPVHTHSHTHTHSPARRCYGNRDRELFPTARAEDLCFQQCPGVWGSRRSPRGAGGAPQREEKRGAGGLGAPTPGDAPITRRLAGGRSGPGRARNSNYFLRSCRTGLPLRARLLWGWVLGATALRRPWGCSPMLPEQPRSLQWGQRWPPWKCILIPGPEPRSGFAWGETGVKGQKAGLGQAARDIPKASPAAQPRGPDPSGQGPQQGVGDSGRSRPTQRPSWFSRRKRGH